MRYIGTTKWTSAEQLSDIEWNLSYEIKLDDVYCIDTEWESCSYNSKGNNCGHYEDVFLSCSSDVELEEGAIGLSFL